MVWGVFDQGLSSATNFGMSILAGRLLGPAGLGVVFLGFSAFLLVFSFVRALVIQPLVVATARLERAEQEAAARSSFTLVLAIGCLATLLMVAVGITVEGDVGRALVIYSPWVGVAMLQDLWRSILFRDGRGRDAAGNDAVWAVGMIAMVPFASAFSRDWAIAATWGVGAGAAACFGIWQVRLRPARLATAVRWWTRDARRLGSWLVVENIILTAGSQAVVFVLASKLGAGDLGGIRAAEVAFAPMTFVGEAFALPGLPAMARSIAVSTAQARRTAWRLGWGALALVGAYLAVVTPFRQQVLSLLFGSKFVRYIGLVVPFGGAQLLRALATGFSLLIRADRRVRALVLVRVVATGTALVLCPILASLWGVTGAAWGLALGSAIGSVASMWCGLAPRDIPSPSAWRRSRRAMSA
jgi:O-antigen/teichoic acid export membrane protein